MDLLQPATLSGSSLRTRLASLLPDFQMSLMVLASSPVSTCIIESTASGKLSVEERAVNCANTSTALVSALETRSTSGPALFVDASAIVGCTVVSVAGSTGSGSWSSPAGSGHRRAAALRRARSAQVRLQARPLLGMRSNRCASSASTWCPCAASLLNPKRHHVTKAAFRGGLSQSQLER